MVKRKKEYSKESLINQKNIILLLGVLFLSLFLLTVTKFIKKSATKSQQTVTIPSEASARLLEQNNSNQNGTVTLTQEFGKKVKVLIELENAPNGVRQPAHIHSGSCIKLGEIKFPLNDLVGGKSETSVVTSMAELVDMLPLAVNVHKSGTQASTYVSCGNL